MKIPDSWRPWIDTLLHEEPWATRLAFCALILMVVGSVLTIWRGRWYARLVLLAGAAIWPLPDHHLFQRGRVLVALEPGHGVHTLDLLSLVAVGIALIPWATIWRGIGRLGRRRRGDVEDQTYPYPTSWDQFRLK